MTYCVTCDGVPASPDFRSVGQAEDYRDILVAHFKDYLPMRFQVEYTEQAKQAIFEEFHEFDVDPIADLEDQVQELEEEVARLEDCNQGLSARIDELLAEKREFFGLMRSLMDRFQ